MASSPVSVLFHPSQFPGAVRRDLLDCLEAGAINHKFHYDSIKQSQAWLELHAAYSPARTDPDCAATYDRAFGAVAELLPHANVHVIGLGCGGGQKDTRLIEKLKAGGRQLRYTPVDVSTPLVLVAREAAETILPRAPCVPLVCDLATADGVAGIFTELEKTQLSGVRSRSCLTGRKKLIRALTFFGMLPNFEPAVILPKLAAMVRLGDYLLLSANLAAGPNYAAGVRRVLPLYDNQLTRGWLMLLLRDLGVEDRDGRIRFRIEKDSAGNGLRRISAYFDFLRGWKTRVGDRAFAFRRGDSIRLFFSYRHTPERVRSSLARYGLEITQQWITAAGDEGIFLARRC